MLGRQGESKEKEEIPPYRQADKKKPEKRQQVLGQQGKPERRRSSGERVHVRCI